MPRGQLNFSGAATVGSDPVSTTGTILGRYADRLAQQEQRDARNQQQLEARNAAERQRIATNEGISATLNPTQFGAQQVATEQAGIAQSLANLSPADRAIAQQQITANYNPATRGQEVVTAAINNPNADQLSLLRAASSQANINRSNLSTAQATPGTPEYQAIVAAKEKERVDILARQKALFDYKNNANAAADQKEANALATVLNQGGVKVPQGTPLAAVKAIQDNANATQTNANKLKIKAAEREAKQAQKDLTDAKLRLSSGDKNATQFRNRINIPLQERSITGRDDTTFFNKFFDNKQIQAALRSNKLTSKQVEGRIQTLLQANDGDLEDSLESLSEILTGSTIDL